jgi:NAD-dependent dihydropyrimidine dehydrogenase PreA subunit
MKTLLNRSYLKNVVSLQLDPQKCNGCGMCLTVCPHQVFALINKKSSIVNRDQCMECGACKTNCQNQAIEVRSGVGCAAGIINGILNNTEPTCSCSQSESSCC